MRKTVIAAAALIALAALYVYRSEPAALKAAGLAGKPETAHARADSAAAPKTYVLEVVANPTLAPIESVEPRPVATKK